jgi:predicted transcriptional regulator YdeE
MHISKREAVSLYGLKVALTTSQTKNYKIITDHWQHFNRFLQSEKKAPKDNWEKYGVTLKIDQQYFYMAAIPSQSALENFEKVELISGEYACFEHRGAMSNIKETIFNIYKKEIDKHEIILKKERKVLHFEHYDHLFKWNKDDSVIKIYLPIL